MLIDRRSLEPSANVFAAGECVACGSTGARLATGLWYAGVAAMNGISRIVGGYVARRARDRRRRAALRELHTLDDRMLKDIGLNRGQLPEVAERMAASGKPIYRRPHW